MTWKCSKFIWRLPSSIVSRKLKWWGCIGVTRFLSSICNMDFFITSILFHPNTCTSCICSASDALVLFIAGESLIDFEPRGVSKPSSDEHAFRFVGLDSTWSRKGTILWLIGASMVLMLVNLLFDELMNHVTTLNLELWDEELATLYCQWMLRRIVRPVVDSEVPVYVSW